WSQALILAPPSAERSAWMQQFGDCATAFASGWMLVRGTRRRRGSERGFVLSDHDDWPGLLDVIKSTGAEQVFVEHGYVAPMVRWLREQGLQAQALQSGLERDPSYASREA